MARRDGTTTDSATEARHTPPADRTTHSSGTRRRHGSGGAAPSLPPPLALSDHSLRPRSDNHVDRDHAEATAGVEQHRRRSTPTPARPCRHPPVRLTSVR
ncbi:hypothetical protein [Halospeciosus flavus]|uniref:Uncharacterized protein n=1 Tax=Halospeciosus flavus TaxID=3032283 RepID=A0ABD5Z4F2_9EURY